MWQGVKILTKAASLSTDLLALVKLNAVIEWDDHDVFLTHLIDTAASMIDGPAGAGIALGTQTWRKTLDRFPCQDILLPGSPVTAVSAVNYVDIEGNADTVDLPDTLLDTGSDVARLSPVHGSTWPSTREQNGAVTIDYTLGHADWTTIDKSLIDAILLYTAHRYINREAIIKGEMSETPFGWETIMIEYRRGRFAT